MWPKIKKRSAANQTFLSTMYIIFLSTTTKVIAVPKLERLWEQANRTILRLRWRPILQRIFRPREGIGNDRHILIAGNLLFCLPLPQLLVIMPVFVVMRRRFLLRLLPIFLAHE